MYISVWIRKKDAIELPLIAPKAGVFFSPETISKGDDIKIKRKVSPFFLLLHVYLPFIAILSLFKSCSVEIFIGTEKRKMVWKRATLVPDALQSLLVIRNDHISPFPGH